ncbi:MAG: XRE family transcriptional regulator [Nakamurella sp.]
MVAELQQLGARLRAARTARGWTLDDLAPLAGMSVSTLSRLESGKRQASLELLIPLTRALGIRVDDLLVPAPVDPRVARPSFRRPGMTVRPLAPEDSTLLAYAIDYEPGIPLPEPNTHPGRDWLYVTSGKLLLRLGSQELVLARGEAAEFDTLVPHAMGAAGARPARIISIFNQDGDRLHVHSLVGDH